MQYGSCQLACLQLAIVFSFNFGVISSISYNSASVVSPLSYIVWSAVTGESTSPPTLPPFSLFSSDQAVIIWNDDMETNDGWQLSGDARLPSSEKTSCCGCLEGRCAYLDALEGDVSITKTTNISAYKSIQFALDIFNLGSPSSTGHFKLQYKYDNDGWIEYKRYGMDTNKQWHFDQFNLDLPVSTQFLTIRIYSAATKHQYYSRAWVDNTILIGIRPTAFPSQTPTTFPNQTPTIFPSQTPSTFPSRSSPITTDSTSITTPKHQTLYKDGLSELSIALTITAIVSCLAIIMFTVYMVKKRRKTHKNEVMRIEMKERHNVVPCSDESDKNTHGMEKERDIVISWLRYKVGLPEYIPLFLDYGFDSMRIVKAIEGRQDLIDIGVKKVGHQMLFLKEIKKIQATDFNINTSTRQGNACEVGEIMGNEEDSDSDSVHMLYVNKPVIMVQMTPTTRDDTKQVRSRISSSSMAMIEEIEGVNIHNTVETGYTCEGPNDIENRDHHQGS